MGRRYHQVDVQLFRLFQKHVDGRALDHQSFGFQSLVFHTLTQLLKSPVFFTQLLGEHVSDVLGTFCISHKVWFLLCDVDQPDLGIKWNGEMCGLFYHSIGARLKVYCYKDVFHCYAL